MFRRLLIILAALTLLFAGCGGGVNEEKVTSGTGATAVSTPASSLASTTVLASGMPAASADNSIGSNKDNPVLMGEPFLMPDGIEVTVVKAVKGSQAWQIVSNPLFNNDPPVRGMQYLVVTLSVKNISSTVEPYPCIRHISIMDSSGNEFHLGDKIITVPGGEFFGVSGGSLAHGDEETGSLCFYVLDDEPALTLTRQSEAGGERTYFEIEATDEIAAEPTTQATAPTTQVTPPITPPTTAPAPETTRAPIVIADALAEGLIQIEIKGNSGTSIRGVSSGDIIIISFLRQTPETIEITVPPGTTLTSSDAEKQNMVIMGLKGRDPTILGYYSASRIILDDDTWTDYLFEAYCLDMHKGNILDSTTFSLGQPASAEVVAVLSAAKSTGEDAVTTAAVQIALWAVIDNPSRAELEGIFSVNDEDMAGAWDILEKAGLNPASRQLFTGYTPG